MCLALRRTTAAAFHCMKVLESHIGVLFAWAGLENPIAAGERNWRELLRRLQGAESPELRPAMESLEALSRRWHAATLSPADKYTDEEAERIYQLTCAFVRAVQSENSRRL